MGRRRIARDKKGFSLLEVLVSLTVLALGLLGLALLQVTALKGKGSAPLATVGTELAQDRLDRFREEPWTRVISSDAAAFDNSAAVTAPRYERVPDAAGDIVVARGATYFRVWRVVDPATGTVVTAGNRPNALLKNISVWCCWRDGRGGWHHVMLVTQRTNVGP